jgi:hypothetical protein
VDPRSGLDDVKKRKLLILSGFELRILGRPSHSQPLYGLLYPASSLRGVDHITSSICRIVLHVIVAHDLQSFPVITVYI